MKLYVYRANFFTNAEAAWNRFDFLLVVVLLLDGFLSGVGGIDMKLLRILHLLRVARVIRLFKAVHFMRDLHVMWLCVVNSMWTLLWTLLFLGFSLFIAALLLVQVMHIYRVEDSPPAQVTADIIDWFGTVQDDMLVVFMGTTGGMSWGVVHDVVVLSGAFNSAIF